MLRLKQRLRRFNRPQYVRKSALIPSIVYVSSFAIETTCHASSGQMITGYTADPSVQYRLASGNSSAIVCIPATSKAGVTPCPTINRLSRAIAITTKAAPFLLKERKEFIHLDQLARRCVTDGCGEVRRHLGHPVGDTLMDDAEQSADGPQAHSFEIEPDGLLMDRDAVALFLRSGSKVTLAGTTAKALTARAVVPSRTA